MKRTFSQVVDRQMTSFKKGIIKPSGGGPGHAMKLINFPNAFIFLIEKNKIPLKKSLTFSWIRIHKIFFGVKIE